MTRLCGNFWRDPRIVRSMKRFALPFLIAALAAGAAAQVSSADVEYGHGETVLLGYRAVPGGAATRKPAVIVVHDWNGIDEYEKGRVRQLAELGYVGFAADVYGKGVRPANPKESAAEAGKYRGDRALLRARLQAALDRLRQDPEVDPERIAVMGYCFGGMGALELARSGAPVVAAISFHGNLDTPRSEDAANIRGKVLVLHGADDPLVPPAQVEAFAQEMREAKVDWQLIAYGGAVHSFTEPKAGDDPSRGSAYHAPSDRRSWEHLRLFLRELFER
jgi:dienelactone hydrolase